MAGYREHISVSGLCGVGYGAAATLLMGFTPAQGMLAGALAWVAGMLPDLDSQSGRPVREIFGLTATVAPFVMMRHLVHWAGDLDGAVLMAIGLFAAVRYGAPRILGKLSVHRGMFHSVPALVIAAELTFLGYKSESPAARFLMAGGVALGFLSHLLLDEFYSVQWTGVRIKLNKAAGSALKMFSRRLVPNVVAWGLMFALSWAVLLELGLTTGPETLDSPAALPHALDEPPLRR